MRCVQGARLAPIAIFVALAAVTQVQAAAEIWRNDWFLSAPPTFVQAYIDVPDARTAFAPDGDILFAGMTYPQTEYQFTRIAADGSLRWSANVGSGMTLSTSGPSALIATADGGAIATFGYLDGTSENIARIDASGAIAWMRALPALSLAEIGADRIGVAACGGALTMLDRKSGDVLWQQLSGGYGGCAQATRLTVDDAANIYTLAQEENTYRILKHDADGHLVWDVASGATVSQSASIVGVSAGVLYVDAADELHAVRSDDGATLWSVDTVGSVFFAGTPPEPIVLTHDSVSRLAADTGIARWTTPLPNTGLAEPVADALVVADSYHTVARVDLGSGAVLWTATLPQQDGAGHPLQYFRFGGLQAGVVSAVARPLSFAVPAAPFVQRFAFSDGSPVGALDIPAVAQAPYGSSVADGASRILGVQTGWTVDAPDVRIRSLDAADGSERWQQIAAPDFAVFAPNLPTTVMSTVGTAGPSAAVAAACSLSSGGGPGIGMLWLGLYDSDSGDPRWQKVIRDADQGSTYISEPPVADAQGDIYVAAGALIPCDLGGQGCARQTLLKVSEHDGDVLWRFDNATYSGSNYAYAQEFTLAGPDVIVSGPFADPLSSAALVSLSGSDGTMRWSSAPFGAGAVAAVFPVADGILVTGNGWAKLDAGTGQAIWTGPGFAPACSALCYQQYDGVVRANDDLILAGEGDYEPLVTLLRGDGSGTFESWRLEPNSPAVRSAATQIRKDSTGRIWLGLLRSNRGGPGGLFVLAELDPATGSLLSQQVVRDRIGDPLERITLTGLLGSPESNRLLLAGQTMSAPQPTVSGNVMLDTSITARGDLGVTLDINHDVVHANQLVTFHAQLTYSGDAPVPAARLNVYLPWSSGVRALTCGGTQAGTCATDTASGNVRATVDLEPGAVVDVTGQVLVLDDGYNESAVVTAVGFGPAGLSESDTVNNLARRIVSQALFANGFEAD